MPSYKLGLEAKAGKVKLGDCVIWMDDPEYFCKNCGHGWNREQAIDVAYRKIKTIKVSVGGYFGGYYEVTIDITHLETTWIFVEGQVAETIQKSIRVSTVEALLRY